MSFVMLIETFFLNFHIIKLFNHIVDSICSNITSLIVFLINEREMNNPCKI